jgi:hypothetical protein
MVFNATFNNISVISWRSVLLVKETEAPNLEQIYLNKKWQNTYIGYGCPHIQLNADIHMNSDAPT